jgi:transglutaminase-like putative cysteine protease
VLKAGHKSAGAVPRRFRLQTGCTKRRPVAHGPFSIFHVICALTARPANRISGGAVAEFVVLKMNRLPPSYYPLIIVAAALSFSAFAVGDDRLTLDYGPELYVSFCPTLVVEAKEEPITVRVWLPRPQTDASQRITAIVPLPQDTSPRPIFDRGRLNHLLGTLVSVEPDSPVTIGYRAIIAIRTVRLNPAAFARSGPWEFAADERKRLERFLTLTPHTQLPRDELRAALGPSIEREPHPILKAQRLYHAVLARLEYHRADSFKGAARAWAEQVGECTDYAACFVALCRNFGIPARSVCGFALVDDRWDLHAWAEFYVREIGWIPCDATYGEKSADEHFGRLKSPRVAVSRDFDLEFGPPLETSVPILQEYVYRYQGPQRPTLHWRISGELLGTTLTPDVQERVLNPRATGSRTP